MALYYSFTDTDLSTTKFTDSEMFKETDRLKTFDKWPVSFISKDDMSSAGFYFLGIQDCVRCPFCVVQIGAGTLATTHSPVRDAGPRVVVSRAGYFTRSVPIGSDPQ
jgi:hypothetical protein